MSSPFKDYGRIVKEAANRSLGLMDGYRHDFDRRKGAENLLGNDRSQPLDKLIAAVLDDVLNPSIDDTVVDGLVKVIRGSGL